EWKQAVGTATSIRLSLEGVTTLVPDLLRGLDRLGVQATGAPDEVRIALIRRKLQEIEKDKGKPEMTTPQAIRAESVPQAREVRPALPTGQQLRSQPQLQRS